MMAMHPMFAIVTESTLNRRGASGLVHGPIVLRLDDALLPAEGWDDSPVVLLGWWLESVLKLSKAKNADFLFMEGPYEFQAEAVAPGQLTVTFLQRRRDGSKATLKTTSIGFDEFRSHVITVAQACLDVCRERKWTSSDIETLSPLLIRARSMGGSL